jgi:MSHA biogenesis protein MshK
MSRLLLAASMAMAACAAAAAPFADPTRPPGASDPGAPSAKGGEVAALRLESVLIAPDRRIAVINGQAVRVGQRIGDARVLRITETEVALREGASTQILKLYPAAERHPAGKKAREKTK